MVFRVIRFGREETREGPFAAGMANGLGSSKGASLCQVLSVCCKKKYRLGKKWRWTISVRFRKMSGRDRNLSLLGQVLSECC